jgi:hypothetical protein
MILRCCLSWLSILLVLLVSACSQAAGTPVILTPSAEAPAPTASIQPLAEDALLTSSPTAAAEEIESTTLPLPHYAITATLSYNQHLLRVEERIDYTNRSTDALLEMRLMVDPIYYPGVFNLGAITWGNGASIENYRVENGQIVAPLPLPLLPGEAVSLQLSYELALPSPQPSVQVRPVPFGYTARQTNLVDWYPFIPPYRSGLGWLANPAGFFGEHLVYEEADFDVWLRVEDAPPGTLLAASALPIQDGDWQLFEHTSARNFAWSASPEYQILSTQVGDTTINSYVFPMHASAGQAVLDTTAKALALYNELYGEYPRALLSVVEADFLDGMEYDGLYFLSNGFYNLYQGSPGDYLTTIAAHETAHQWFYPGVGNDQAYEPWLDEALCTYQEHIFFEKIYPEALDWWWDYRVNYYQPHGWVNGSIYNPEGYRAYRDAVYLNGAVFLDELRSLIGDEIFFAFLRDYVSQSWEEISTGAQFFEILSKHTDQDITPLVNRFFKQE